MPLDPADTRWLARLASALIADPHGADDLVQETLVTALRVPPPEGPGRRPWLATVARRLANREHRATARRRRRERAAAAPEALPDTAALLEHAETAELLAAAARALPEPSRRTVLLHFLEQRSTHEIAAAEGVSPDTVRKRLRRGLDLLRTDLQRRDRRTWPEWRAALAPVAVLPRHSARLSPFALVAAQPLLALLVITFVPLSVFALTSALTSSAARPATEPMLSLPSGTAFAGSVPRTLRPSPMAAHLTEPRVSVREEEPSSSEDPSEESMGGVRGVLVDPDGQPVVGASVWLHGWPSNDRLVREHGNPGPFKDLVVETDTEGAFEIRFEPHPALQYGAESSAVGFGASGWRFSELPAGEVQELGVVTLVRSGSLLVRPRMLDGSVFPVQARMSSEPSGNTAGPGGDRPRTRWSSYDPAVGETLVEGVSAGPVAFEFKSDALGWMGGSTVQVLPGETTEVTWVYEGPDPARCLGLTIRAYRAARCWTSEVSSSLRLVSESTGQVIEGGFEARQDLEPGSYTVELEDPMFQPLQLTGLETGARHDVWVAGSATLDVRVLDAPNGSEVTDYALYLTYPTANSSSNTIELTAKEGVPPGGLFEGIVPVPVRIDIEAGEAGIGRVELESLGPGMTAAVDVVLVENPTLEVLLREAGSGAPLGETDFVLLEGPLGDAPDGVASMSDQRHQGRTDPSGRAVLRVPPISAAWVGVGLPGGLFQEERFEAESGSLTSISMDVAAPASVTGQVVGFEPDKIPGGVLVFSGRDPGSTGVDAIQRRVAYKVRRNGPLRVPLDEDGRFGPFELGAGTWRVGVMPIESSGYGRFPDPSPWLFHGEPRVLESGGTAHWVFGEEYQAPGRAEVGVRLDGAAAAGARFVLRNADSHHELDRILDGAGATSTLVPPGIYDLILQVRDRSGSGPSLWSPLGPGLTVPSGESVLLELDLETARRALMLRDLDGHPILEGSVDVLPVDAPPEANPGWSQGWYEQPRDLWMAVGRYRVDVDGEKRVEFDWVAGEGPLEVTVP